MSKENVIGEGLAAEEQRSPRYEEVKKREVRRSDKEIICLPVWRYGRHRRAHDGT